MDVHNDATHPIPVPTPEMNALPERKCQARIFVVIALVPKAEKDQVSSIVLATNEIAKSQMQCVGKPK